jgi:hypothetical protein
MYQVSELTGERYEAEDQVFFRNYIQAAAYINWSENGSKVLTDLFVDSNQKLVFVFPKSVHEKLKHKWINKNNEYHTLKESGGQRG